MKNMGKFIWRAALSAVLMCMLVGMSAGVARSAPMAYGVPDAIPEGVYMGDISLAGMTADEAKAAVGGFVSELKQKNITFGAVDEHYVAVTAGDLGLKWDNEQDIEEAAGLGKKGNIVRRYKALEDLKHGSRVYDLALSLDRDIIRSVLEEQCAEYDVPPINNTMKRTGGKIVVEEGRTGQRVNVEESLEKTYVYITEGWDYKDASIDLVIDVTEPKGSIEVFERMTDVLGTYTTSYSSSGKARSKNVENGCRLVNGTLLYPGDEFSTYDTIKPFTEANGYYPAGSYVNGKVVDSLGGGICQVSTTLYNAVLLAELDVTERNNHSMIVTYVKPSMDAAIAESAGKDFRFKNNFDNPVYIEGQTEGKKITFTIYGVEQRDPGHKVRYESETLTTTEPPNEVITPAADQGIGYISVEAAHIGYTAQLWRIVEENGVEVSREIINKSKYKMSPRTATVGTGTDNPAYAERINAAIASGSIDACKAEAAAIKAEIETVAQQVAALEAYNQALLEQQQLLLQQQLLQQQAQEEQQAEP